MNTNIKPFYIYTDKELPIYKKYKRKCRKIS